MNEMNLAAPRELSGNERRKHGFVLGFAAAMGVVASSALFHGERPYFEGQKHDATPATGSDANGDGVIELSGLPAAFDVATIETDPSVERAELSEYIDSPERRAKLQQAMVDQTALLIEALENNPQLEAHIVNDNGDPNRSSFMRVQGIDADGNHILINIFGREDDTSSLQVKSETGTFGFIPRASSVYVFPSDMHGDRVSKKNSSAAISNDSTNMKRFVTSFGDGSVTTHSGADGLIVYREIPNSNEVLQSDPIFSVTDAQIVDATAVQRINDMILRAGTLTSPEQELPRSL